MADARLRFNPLDWPLCLELPRRCRAIAWHEHIPFAFALISMVRPRVLVELGVHTGDSYLAFCQAVLAAGLPTRCYGVDTWDGDPHAGHYGAEVLEELTAYHQPLYAGFSRLVRSTFDEAVGHFTDGTIDLLHIDGLHTYEAVLHDWTTWRPKLSGGGIALFHDINVRERDFGVWRLWDEVSREHSSFRFDHGHGLGVLLVGANAPDPLLRLSSSPEEEQQRVRTFFAALGQRLTLIAQIEAVSARLLEYDEALRARAATEESLRRELADHDAALRARQAEAEGFQRHVLEYDVALRSRNAEFEQARARIDEQDRTMRLREAEVELLRVSAEHFERRLRELEASVRDGHDQLVHAQETLRAVTSSRTYRLARVIAAPFRRLRRRES